MKITILTLCPEVFEGFLKSHVVERAAALDLCQVKVVDIRDFTKGSFRDMDDSPYGGGKGMILRVDALTRALRAVQEDAAGAETTYTMLFSPRGTVYRQKDAHRLAEKNHLILVCGHYEGVDERFSDYVDEEISVGDYILTGGEIPAMAVVDSVLRLLKGNLKEGSAEEESFETGLLEYPQYTHPLEFEGKKVPEVLLSGDHQAIEAYRKQEMLRVTQKYRPDLLERKE